MKFEEAIDIFDKSSKLMLVTTYKKLCRLNGTKMMEVTNDMKKIKKNNVYRSGYCCFIYYIQSNSASISCKNEHNI